MQIKQIGNSTCRLNRLETVYRLNRLETVYRLNRLETVNRFLENRKMSSSLSKILETEINVFKSNSQIMKNTKYYQISK